MWKKWRKIGAKALTIRSYIIIESSFPPIVERRVHENAKALASSVILNLRGTRFQVRKEILLRFPNTYFSVLFGGNNWRPENDGSYFIDRDPLGFGVMISYLSDYKFDVEGLSERELRAVKEHFDYFLIPYPGDENASYSEPLWEFDRHTGTKGEVRGGKVRVVDFNHLWYCQSVKPIKWPVEVLVSNIGRSKYETPILEVQLLFLRNGQVDRIVKMDWFGKVKRFAGGSLSQMIDLPNLHSGMHICANFDPKTWKALFDVDGREFQFDVSDLKVEFDEMKLRLIGNYQGFEFETLNEFNS